MRARALLLLAAALLVVEALDYYRELGVKRSSSLKEIKAAYRDAAIKWQPDKCKEDRCGDKIQRIANAYETLSDPEKRRLYDLHGSDYARVQQQHEQQERARRQQEDFFNAFGGGGRGRRSGAPPIFSSTTWIGSDAYRDLVEDSTDSWLVQFYHDWSEPCKEFAPRWEALAGKLPPMVRLGRVNMTRTASFSVTAPLSAADRM